jgi:hypothetical protein
LRRQKREPKKGDRKVTSTAPLASGLDIDGAKHALRNPINLPSGSQLCRTKNGKALKLATLKQQGFLYPFSVPHNWQRHMRVVRVIRGYSIILYFDLKSA